MVTKRNPHYVLNGRISNQQDKPLEGLVVRAYDQDPKSKDDFIGQAVTDADGKYTIRFIEEQFKPGGKESGGPDVFIRVFDGNTQIGKSRVKRNAQKQIQINKQVDYSKDKPDDSLIYVVSGRVTQTNGNPIAGSRLLLLDKKLLAKDDIILGEIKTDTDGNYEAKYVSERGTGADLLIQILDQNDEVVTTSPLIVEAAKDQIVDLVVDDHEAYPDLPEFEQLQQRLQPFLNGADPAELDKDSISLLAGKSRINPINIAYLVQAKRLAGQTGIEPEAFYGLLRADQPVSLPALVVQDQAILKQYLEGAAEANIISPKIATDAETVLKTLSAQRVDLLLEKPDLPVGSTYLGGLLDVADIDDNQKRAFAEKFAAYNSTSQEFWDELANDNTFDEKATGSVRLAIQLGTLTQNNDALMKSLHKQLGGSGQDLRGLVGKNEAEWLRDIRQYTDQNGNVLLPPDLPEIEGQSPEETYARTMMRLMESAFPTPTVATTLGRNDFNGANTIKDFIDQYGNFEFRDQNLRLFLQDNNIQVSDDGRENLFAFKRVFDLAPSVDRYRVMQPLLQNKDTSAYRISKMGQRKFLDRYEQVMGADAARRVYRAASQKSAVTTALFAANSPLVNNLGLHVIPEGDLSVLLNQAGQAPGVDLPTWESLFGSIGFCACKHCRSVYSPAAYLVDLLAFLKNQQTGLKTALDVLFERRGDIGKIELNCHNTNTTLPYVDLVIEVLEHYLANESANPGMDWWDVDQIPQTVGEREDLRVHPENIVAAAYGLLQSIDFPWSLPFNLWTAEMRTYLEPLGIKRAEIMRLLNPHPADALPETLRNDIATEMLGLIPREWSILLGQVANGLAGWGGEPITELRKVKTLMNRGRLSYAEIRQLLETKFINNAGNLKIEFTNDLCDLNEATIPTLVEQPDTGGIHRFMRLQRRLDWDIYDLDAAIQVLGGGNLDAAFLRRLAVVKHLHHTLGTPVLTLLSWWGNIDTTRRKNDDDEEQPSLYDRLFLNRSIGDKADLNPFVLNSNLDELADLTQNLTDERAAILAALNLITAEELDLIIQKRGISGDLNLANLSELYRIATMAKALKLSVTDFLHLLELTGFAPFTLSNIEAIPNNLLDVKAVIKASDTSILELAYILNHVFEADSVFATGDAAIGDFLFRLRFGLKAFKEAYPLIPDPNQQGSMTVAPDTTGERTRLLLGQLVPESMLDQTMAVIEGTPDMHLPGGTQNPIDRDAIIDEHFSLFIDNLPSFKNQFINEDSGTYLDPDNELVQRYHNVLDPLTKYLLETNSITLVQQSFADFLDIDLRASDQLLGGLIKDIADSSQPAGAVFLDDAFIDSEEDSLAEAAFNNQFQMVRRLQKIALLLNQFDIPSGEVRWLAEESPQLGWLDLNALPVDAQNVDPARFQAWLRMAQFAWLRQQLPANETSLFALLRMTQTGRDEKNNPVDKAQFITHLHVATGWNQTDIETLLDSQHFDLTFNNQFTGQQALEHFIRLYHVVQLLQRLGVSADEAWTWAVPDVTRQIASEVKQAARAKFSIDQWPSVAKPIRDGLRLQQRNALVDAALEIARTDTIEEIADLYAYFLMDVEMNPCMLTSRIKQAISSVQLFVQRCLMNLEQPVVQLDEEAARQWEWMKNYRVWEANRKIFLYPENWIEPELRPEKSPFFIDLENELLQNDVTSETVETAFLNYLEKLDEVARLEIASVYNDEEEAGTLHVLGRTKAVPHKYFCRRWENRRRWTPWEAVPVDIEGENVAITRYNRRLYLFWFMTQEKADESQNESVIVPKADLDKSQSFTTDKPAKYLEITLAWSENRSGKWMAKKLSNVTIRTKPWIFYKDPEVWRPRALAAKDGDTLRVAVEQTLALAPNIEVRLDLQVQILDSEFINGDSVFEFSSDGTVTTTAYHVAESVQLVDHPTVSAAPIGNLKKIPPRRRLRIRAKDDEYLRVIKSGAPDYHTVAPLQYVDFVSQAPLFYGDARRSYVIEPRSIFRPDLDFDFPSIAEFEMVARLNAGGPTGSRPGLVPAVVEAARIASSSNAGLIVAPRADTGVVAGLGTLASSPTVANPLVATNVFDLDTAATPSPIPGTTPSPFVMDDNALVAADWVVTAGETTDGDSGLFSVATKYRFHIFYHPYVNFLIKQLNRFGIDRLLDPIEGGEADELRRQQKKEKQSQRFAQVFELGEAISKTNLPVEDFDFSYTGAYALYNWELFFHAPLLIAARLSANRQFKAAQKWFHYLFDPTDVSTLPADDAPYRYWKIKPFFENRALDNIRELLNLLSSNDPQNRAKRTALEAQIADWRDNAFQPHRIAEQRFVAYQKTTVMKYLDNLITWGDHLFRQDSIESINEATQLYILAAQILGKQPEALPELKGDRSVGGNIIKTFDDLDQNNLIDAFGNALVEIENELSAGLDLPETPVDEALTADIIGTTLFFCVPRNDKLLSYWDIIADRLFKIRNCMNIEGVVRQLSLFEPPIDPDLLVRAVAAGIDIGSILNDMKAPRLQYRYNILVQKAIEFCNDVKQLGGALLSALEKRDAEALALLRASHEVRVQEAIRTIREFQVSEAEETIDGLNRNKELIEIRRDYYGGRDFVNVAEGTALTLSGAAITAHGIGVGLETFASSAYLAPRVTIGISGFGGSPVFTITTGGESIGSSGQAAANVLYQLSTILNQSASLASTIGSYQRRQDEWEFQRSLAAKELEQIENQIIAAEIRKSVAENELSNQELQIEQSREVEEFMRTKFTNRELYSWMVSQVSTIYFQSYQLAYDMAMRAQQAFQYELAEYNASFINFGYWDSLKKGLLASDQLHYDLRRMEAAYFEANRREYELTKNISLLQLNPAALIQLRETGSCEIDIPEVMFDLDYPGHFLRRIKSVSLTIPCVTGPYTSVNCTLTLLNNRIRVSTDRPSDAYSGLDDNRFISNLGGDQSIATSTAREDSGLFEFNFRDERYLPFEGAGAVSRWRLELPALKPESPTAPREYPQFDYDTIADVVLHMRYTAREGGTAFKMAVLEGIENAVNALVDAVGEQGLFHFVSMKHEFGTAFHKFLNPIGTDEHNMTIPLSKQHFPFLFQGKDINIQNVIVFVKLRDESLYNDTNALVLTISRSGGAERNQSLVTAGDELGGLAHATYSQLSGEITTDEDWIFMVKDADVQNLPSGLKETVNIDSTSLQRIKKDELGDLGLLIQYKIS